MLYLNMDLEMLQVALDMHELRKSMCCNMIIS